jgi:hypothetical protein
VTKNDNLIPHNTTIDLKQDHLIVRKRFRELIRKCYYKLHKMFYL